MEKAIIVLNGKNDGKTAFVELTKNNGFWVWNVNHRNVLSMLAHKVGWDGNRTKEYYSFVDDFRVLANKHFDSERKYIFSMIDKFNQSEKANILIVHGCDAKISKEMQDKYFNIYTINITTSNENIENNSRYCKVLNCNSDNYNQEILDTLNIITKDFSKEKTP